MSNGNCGQRESSCNPLTGVDTMRGRKQPNVWRPCDGSILGSTCGYMLSLTVEESVRARRENKGAGDELLVRWRC